MIRQGYSTNLDEILFAIGKQDSIDPQLVIGRFWEMFVVDALLGNFDRHNGNWGFYMMKWMICLANCPDSFFKTKDFFFMKNGWTNPHEPLEQIEYVDYIGTCMKISPIQ